MPRDRVLNLAQNQSNIDAILDINFRILDYISRVNIYIVSIEKSIVICNINYRF